MEKHTCISTQEYKIKDSSYEGYTPKIRSLYSNKAEIHRQITEILNIIELKKVRICN